MNNENFKKLQAKWYKKLERNGFQDIEDANGQLKQHSNTAFFRNPSMGRKVLTPDQIAAKLEYYIRAEQYLNNRHNWPPGGQRIWRMHSEGMPTKEIARVLKRPYHRVYNKLNELIAEFRAWRS